MTMTPAQDSFIKSLFEQYYQDMFLYAKATLYDASLADDVVQDCFLALARRVDEVETHERPELWLMKTLQNKVKKCAFLRARDSAVFLSLSAPNTPEPGDVDQKLVRIDQGWTGDLERVQQALTQEEFHFLTRQVLDGASHLELAQEFHISVYGTQKKRQRINQKLHKLFPDILQKLKGNDEK